MARQSLGGSAKKAKQKGSVDSPAKGGGSSADGCLTVSVLFTSADDCALADVLLTPPHMTALQIRPGGYVSVYVGEAWMLCRAWTNRRQSQPALASDNAVLNKAWQSSMVDEKKVITIDRNLMASCRMLPCNEVSLVVEAGASAADRPLFRSHLLEMLQGACLQDGLVLTISALGVKVVLRVTGLGTEAFHQISRSTRLQLILNSSLPTASALSSSSSSAVDMEDILHRISGSFAGYAEQAQQAAEALLTGLSRSASAGQDPSSVWKPPKGLILYGPPGTGKSALASALLTAMACVTVRLDARILLMRIEGEAEDEMRRIFTTAARRAPCVLLMENMHLLCASRSAATVSDSDKRLVSCWLTLVDGLHADNGVFILGTTARIMDLDAAVRRPGRMDCEIELSVPAAPDRLLILQLLLQKAGLLAHEEHIKDTAQQAHGMVGADLSLLIKEAAYHAALRQHSASSAPTMPSTPQHSRDVDVISSGIQHLQLTPTRAPMSPAPAISSPPQVAMELLKSDWLSALQRVAPSALREVLVEVPCVHWEDIGGMLAVKRALRQVVEWPLQQLLRSPSDAAVGPGTLKGVLLYGPPGCSKTLLAKAIATETSMNFLAVRGPELLSKWVGESEKAVQTLFRRARAAAPAVIFFDEIDALAGTRGDSGSGVSDRVLSQLLTELDGVQGLEQVVVVAATNRPDMLDPALVRPGRIDRKIFVPPPDDDSRRSILQLELNKLPVQGEVDFDALVILSKGFSGAELVSVCNDAALRALEQGLEHVDQQLLEHAARQVKPQIDSKMLAFYDDYRRKHRTF